MHWVLSKSLTRFPLQSNTGLLGWAADFNLDPLACAFERAQHRFLDQAQGFLLKTSTRVLSTVIFSLCLWSCPHQSAKCLFQKSPKQKNGFATQFAFLAFLVGQSLDGFAQWKNFVQLLLSCEHAPLYSQPLLYTSFLRILEANPSQNPPRSVLQFLISSSVWWKTCCWRLHKVPSAANLLISGLIAMIRVVSVYAASYTKWW